MAQHLPSKYFWVLDTEVPQDIIEGYQEALAGKKVSGLHHLVSLMGNNIPMPPKAYVTSAFLKKCEGKLTPDALGELDFVMKRFEQLTHQKLGSNQRPLLLTVQGDFCGAIRNIGCSLTTLPALIHQFGAATAFSLYVDFLESYSTLVLGAPHTDFRRTFGIRADREGGAGGLAHLSEPQFSQFVREYQNLISQKIGASFPESSERHLLTTLIHCGRASASAGGDEIYVKVQIHSSQFGQSTQGMAYTRNPFTGKADTYGVFQCGAEGKKSTLEPQESGKSEDSGKSLREKFPATFSLLKRYLPEIEAAFRDVMEVDFVTDEDGHLYFTNFDKANTTARATVVAAIDLNLAGRISDREAALRIKPNDVEVLLHPTLDESSRTRLKDIGSEGVTAAPGTAVGHVYFKMADAIEHYRTAVKEKKDKRVILIADELLISDTPGLGIISGLVTKASGIASHAAVMARANGIPCIVGYKGLEIEPATNTMSVNGQKFKAGTLMTLEAGAEGALFVGEGTLQNLSFKEGIVRDVSQLITRVIKQEGIPLEVRVNINNAKDAETGLTFGADGVGLCRTENMFMEAHALREIRNIVFTQDPELCKQSFEILEETQFQDFKKIFEAMRDRTVNIRLMDLPLHDFAPQTEAAFEELHQQLPHIDKTQLRVVAEGLREHNPMLGLRACRFGLITPQVYDMQIRAIIRAAYAVQQAGTPVNPGIMFPLVTSELELTQLKARVQKIEEKIREDLKVAYGTRIHVRVGSMIELPAAALGADQLARVGEFFAFGTNDLTQTTLGISRDDSAHYLPFYLENGLLPADPFKVLAWQVRELIDTAVTRGQRVRPGVSFGICGEQGGDRATLKFCLEKGLGYVSASPFRVLPTRIALVHEGLNATTRIRLVKSKELAA